METTTPVLFTAPNSIYTKIGGCDTYDAKRDATTWPGGASIVAHPPCHPWSRLHGLAKFSVTEKALAMWAINAIRTYGGILEHPHGSHLFKFMKCGTVKCPDQWGGYMLSVDQSWFGHRAQKKTIVYIVGVPFNQVPAMPMNWALPTHVVATSKKKGSRLELSKYGRIHTPVAFAQWCVAIARQAKPGSGTLMPLAYWKAVVKINFSEQFDESGMHIPKHMRNKWQISNPQ